MGSGAAAARLATGLLVLPACIQPSRAPSEIPEGAQSVVTLTRSAERTLLEVATVDGALPLGLDPEYPPFLFYFAEPLDVLQLRAGPMPPRRTSLCGRLRPWPLHLAAFVWADDRLTPTSEEALATSSMPDFDFEACFSDGGCVGTSGGTLLCNPACNIPEPDLPAPPTSAELPRGCASLGECATVEAPCGPGLARFDGSAECIAIDVCGPGPFRSGARGVFVSVGAEPGDGTIAAPFHDLEAAIATGTTSIVLGAGEWHARWPRRDLRIVGLCASGTTVRLDATANPGSWRIIDRTLELSHLTAVPGVGATGPTIVGRGATVRLAAVAIEGAPGGGISIGGQSRLEIRRAILSSSTWGALLSVTQTSTATLDDSTLSTERSIALVVDSASVAATQVHFRHAGTETGSVAISAQGSSTLTLSRARFVGHRRGAIRLGRAGSELTLRARLIDVAAIGPGPRPAMDAAMTIASGELIALRLAIAEPSLRAIQVHGGGRLQIADLHTIGTSGNPDESRPNEEGAILASFDDGRAPKVEITRWVSIDSRALSIYGPGELRGSDWRLTPDGRYAANVGLLVESSHILLERVALDAWPGLALDLSGATTGDIVDLEASGSQSGINIEESFRPRLELNIDRFRRFDGGQGLEIKSGIVRIDNLTVEGPAGLHLRLPAPEVLTLEVNKFTLAGRSPLEVSDAPAPDAHFENGRITVEDLGNVRCLGDAAVKLRGVRFDRP